MLKLLRSIYVTYCVTGYFCVHFKFSNFATSNENAKLGRRKRIKSIENEFIKLSFTTIKSRESLKIDKK